MTPEVTLTRDAHAWLQKRSGVATIRIAERHGCCGGGAGVPVIDATAPAQPTEYDRIDIDGIAIYVDPELPGDAPLSIRLEGLFGWQRLFVDGAALTSR